MKHLILFDYDGVIVDSLDFTLKAISLTCERMGYDRVPTQEDIRSAENVSFDAIGTDLGIASERLQTFQDLVREILTDQPFQVFPFPGMIELLARMVKDHQVVIVTSNFVSVVEESLQHYGLTSPLPRILGAELQMSKHELVHRVMAHTKPDEYGSILVGDTVSDINAARQSNVQSIAVTWGFHSEERLRGAGADFVVDTPDDLAIILKTFVGHEHDA